MKNPWIIGLISLVAVLIVYYLLTAKQTDTAKSAEAAKAAVGGAVTAKRLAMNNVNVQGYKTGGNIMCECHNGKICFSGNGGSGCSCCAQAMENVDQAVTKTAAYNLTASQQALPFSIKTVAFNSL